MDDGYMNVCHHHHINELYVLVFNKDYVAP